MSIDDEIKELDRKLKLLDIELKQSELDKRSREKLHFFLENTAKLIKFLYPILIGLSFTGGVYVVNDKQDKIDQQSQVLQEKDGIIDKIQPEVDAYNKSRQEAINNKTKRLVYIQFQGSTTRDFINNLRTDLAKENFNLPPAERLTGTYKSEVRYFNKNDKADAEKLAKLTIEYFKTRNCNITLSTVPTLITFQSQKQVNHLELWLSDKDTCK